MSLVAYHDPNYTRVISPPCYRLFISFLFDNWPLRRLYGISREYNYQHFAGGRDRIFRVVGRLRDDVYFDGRYWDNVIVQIDRDDWEEGMGRKIAHRVELARKGRANLDDGGNSRRYWARATSS